MIDKLTYDQILLVSNELKKQIQVLEQISKKNNITEIDDFTSTLEGYTKYLDNTVEINKDDDKALADLKAQIQ